MFQCQTRIDSYFSVKFPSRTGTNVSKRVLEALRKADFGGEEEKEKDVIKAKNSDLEAPTGKFFPYCVPSVENTIASIKEKRKKAGGIANPTRSKSRKVTKIADPLPSAPSASSSCSNTKNPEVIWQKESDKQKLAANKLKAIELFKKSRGRGKRAAQRQASSRAHLSESDSNSSQLNMN